MCYSGLCSLVLHLVDFIDPELLYLHHVLIYSINTESWSCMGH